MKALKNEILSRVTPRIPARDKVLLQARVKKEMRNEIVKIFNATFPKGWTWEQAFEAAFQSLIEGTKPK